MIVWHGWLLKVWILLLLVENNVVYAQLLSIPTVRMFVPEVPTFISQSVSSILETSTNRIKSLLQLISGNDRFAAISSSNPTIIHPNQRDSNGAMKIVTEDINSAVPSAPPIAVPSQSLSMPSFHANSSSLQSNSPSTIPSIAPTRSPTHSPTSIHPTDAPSIQENPSISIENSQLSLERCDISKPLIIRGSVLAHGRSCDVEWTIREVMNSTSGIDLDLEGQTFLQYKQSNLLVQQNFPIYLWLHPNVLVSNVNYLFQLSCGLSKVSIMALANDVPTGGEIQVHPANGIELQTLFDLKMLNWNDTDLPLSFSFGYYLCCGGRVVSFNRGFESNSSQLLPSEITGSNLTVFSIVYDLFNSSSEANFAVSVQPLPSEQARTEIIDIINNTSSTSVLQSMALATAIYGNINCSSASNCSYLNRHGCSTISHTCGPCLTGFVAFKESDSNELCVALSDISRTEKSCPQNCFNRGLCRIQDIWTGEFLSSCTLSNLACKSACVCDAGFGGEACEVAESLLRQKRTVSSFALSNINMLDDEDIDSVIAIATNLVQSSADIYMEDIDTMVLNLSAAFNSLPLQNEVKNRAHELDVFVSLLSPISVALETAVSINDTSSNSNSVLPSLTMLQQFCDLIGNAMISGQEAVRFAHPELRFISFAQSVSTIYNQPSSTPSRVEVPLTSLEEAISIDPSLAELETSGIQQDAKEVSVQLLQLSPFLFNSTTTSAMLAAPVIVRSTGLDSVLVHLQSMRDVEMDITSYNFTTVCRVGQNGSVTTHKCPGSDAEIRHQCRNKNEVFLSFCPLQRLVCASISVNDAGQAVVTQDDGCSIVSQFTDNFVKCRCDLSSNRRRRLSFATSSPSDFVILTSIVAYTHNTQSDATYAISASWFDLDENMKRAVTVYIMFASLWLVGLFVLFGCSYRVRANQAVYKKEKDRKVALSLEENRSPAVIYLKMQEYVQKVFPSVFSQRISFIRLKEELQRNHRWLYFFTPSTGPESDRRRLILGAKLLTFQSMLMFLLAIFYDIQGPGDDGTCEKHLDSTSCLLEKSPFDTDHEICNWTPIEVRISSTVTAQSGVCVYDETSITFMAGLYAFVLVAVMSSLVARPLEYLFDILVAPTADDIKMKLTESTVSKIGRRLSSVARRASEIAANLGQSFNRARSSSSGATYLRVKVGQQTRDIPEDVQTAHRAAYASLRNVAETFQSQMVERVLQRLRIQNSFLNLNVSDMDSDDDDNQKKQVDDDDSLASDSSSVARHDRQFQAIENGEVTDKVHQPVRSSRSGRRQLRRQLSIEDKATEVQLATSVDPPSVTEKVSSSFTMPSPPFTFMDRWWGYLSWAFPTTPPAKPMQPFVEQNFHILCQLIRKQRTWLSPTELKEFDSQWGLEPVTGEFLQDARVSSTEWISSGKSMIIYQEMFRVCLAAEQEIQQLQVATDAHAGLEILHFFILDLLGRDTTAAKIFLLKSEEDFQHVRVVSRAAKFLAGALLFGVNIFFAYFSVLVGYSKSAHWQHSYLIGCVVQFIVEVGLLETMECIWINYCLPSLVANEVSRVHGLLNDTLAFLCAQSSQILIGANAYTNNYESNSQRIFLNAPDFLFVSMQIARAYPTLLESMIVQSYQQYLPGELARKWRDSSRWRGLLQSNPSTENSSDAKEEKKDQEHHSWRQVSVVLFALSGLQMMATFPFFLQKIVLRFLQPFLFAGLVYIWFENIQHSLSYIIIFALVIGYVCMALVWSFFRESQRVRFEDHQSQRLGDIAIVSSEPTNVRKDSLETRPLQEMSSLVLHSPAEAAVMLASDHEQLEFMDDRAQESRSRNVSFPMYEAGLESPTTPGSLPLGSFSAAPSNAAVLNAMSLAVARANRSRTESGGGIRSMDGGEDMPSRERNCRSPISPIGWKPTVYVGAASKVDGEVDRIMFEGKGDDAATGGGNERNRLLSIVSDSSERCAVVVSPSTLPTTASPASRKPRKQPQQRITVDREVHSSDEEENRMANNDKEGDVEEASHRRRQGELPSNLRDEDANSISTVSLHSLDGLV